MASRKQRIRAAVAGLESADQGRRVPERLKRRVAAYARTRLAEGGTIEEAALEVGVSGTSVRRWLTAYREQPAAGFEQVEIVAAEADEEPTRILVHGPAGLVIEGLDVAGLAELLRRLG